MNQIIETYSHLDGKWKFIYNLLIITTEITDILFTELFCLQVPKKILK